MSDMYLFSSAPRAVPSTIVSSKQAKYRDVPVNIMFDKRVVRGPTVQAKPTVIALQPQSSSATLHSKQQNKQTRATASDNHLLSTIPNVSTLQFAYNTSTSVQTDDYLEDLINDVDECDSFAQTDDSHTDHDVDRVLALFAPAVRGIDASTCIEGQELFDFDIEVESILAVLVGKSLDQAEIEVNEEEELAALTKQRAAFTAERARVIAETMRLEAENSRRMAEKQRRYEQERERVTEQQRIALQRDAARAAQQAMLELERQTQAAIKAQWKDPVRQEVESSFMPWLSQSVEIQLAARRQYIERVDALISETIQSIDLRVAECLRIKQEREEYEAQQAAALLAQQAAEQAEQELRRLDAVQRQAEADAEAEAQQKLSEDSEPADEEDGED